MNLFELEIKLTHISQCIDALILLTQRRETHGLDNGLLEQEIEELIRARYDTIREFEDECVKRGKLTAAIECERYYGGPMPETLCQKINSAAVVSR